jgi:hypothetical protein
MKDAFTASDILLYPEFKNARVYFRDDTKGAAMMNYNTLFNEMLFIDAKGDTLALEDQQTIKFISLGSDTFCYNESYIKIIASNRVIKLAEKAVWELADNRKIGSHNRPSTSFAISSYLTENDRFRRDGIVFTEDQVYRKKGIYFFADQFNNFILANKKNLMELYAKNHKLIVDYLDDNKVRFEHKEDLVKLVDFLGKNY